MPQGVITGVSKQPGYSSKAKALTLPRTVQYMQSSQWEALDMYAYAYRLMEMPCIGAKRCHLEPAITGM